MLDAGPEDADPRFEFTDPPAPAIAADRSARGRTS